MIEILKYIYSILQADTDVYDIVGTKVFPDIIPDLNSLDTQIEYPLIMMKRASITPEISKCTSNNDMATVDLTCYSKSYNEAVDLAQKVRDSLDYYKGTVDGKKITYSRMTGISEDFTEDTYYQLLTFTIK